MAEIAKIDAARQEQTPQHATIAAALAAAQAEMGRAKKGAANPHFKTRYADLESVCDAAMPALNRHGIAVVQPMQKDGDDWVMITRFVHGPSGESMETPVPLLLGKRDMQGLGSAMTYARRYGLMALAGIAPEDDDGEAAVASGPASRGPDPAAVNAAIDALTAADSLDALKAAWGAVPKAIQAQPGVIAAKDARKAALTAPADDLGGDEIPY